jgi:hypothetical protein
MTVIYKYMTGEFARQLIDHGRIRINTLHNFQRIEEYGSEIGDQDEGVLYTEMAGHTIDPAEPATLNPSIAQLLDSGSVVFADPQTITGDLVERTANCHIYSASGVREAKLMKRLGEEYNTCVEITDVTQFSQILTASMREQGLQVEDPVCSSVVYAGRRAHHTSQIAVHPALLKDPAYEYQREFRILWPTAEVVTDHIDLQIASLPLLVRLVALDDINEPTGDASS